MTAFVDPGVPGAWRQAPYYETLKRWSVEASRAQPARLVMVRIGTRGFIVLPDREIDIGNVGPNEAIALERGADGRLAVRQASAGGRLIGSARSDDQGCRSDADRAACASTASVR